MMDEYSLKTIKLLLQTNKMYLHSILLKYSTNVPDPEYLTEDNVVKIINGIGNKSQISDKAKLSIYLCKCGSNDVVAREVQLRSLDEGSSIIFICKSCGNRWT